MGNLLKNYPLPIVFKTIYFKKSSGELDVKGPGYHRRLYFIRGNLEYASSNVQAERLGELLRKKRAVTSEQLAQLEGLREERRNEKIGRLLVKSGIVTQKELYRCLVSQFKLIATDTFDLHEGEWEFHKGPPPIPGGQGFSIPLASVIVEGTKQIGGLSFYRSLLSHYPLVASKLSKQIAELLSSFDLHFYQKFILHSGRMAEEIQKLMGFADDAFWRKVLMFYLLNVFDFSEGTPLLSSETETLIIQDGRLQRPSKRTETREDHLRTGEFHEFELGELVRKSQMYEAQAGGSSSIQVELAPPSADSQRQAREAFRLATQLVDEKKHAEAAALLEGLVDPENSPTSHLLLLASCQMRIPAKRPQAVKLFRVLAEREPSNPEPHYALGEIFRAEGMAQLANASYQRALEIKPDHSRARKGLEEVELTVKKKNPPFGRRK